MKILFEIVGTETFSWFFLVVTSIKSMIWKEPKK